VLRGGPDEADGVQHLGDEGGELGRDGPMTYCLRFPLPMASVGLPGAGDNKEG
jgi:hypothetical protein